MLFFIVFSTTNEIPLASHCRVKTPGARSFKTFNIRTICMARHNRECSLGELTLKPELNMDWDKNLTSTALSDGNVLLVCYSLWTASEVAEPLTTTWPQRDDKDKMKRLSVDLKQRQSSSPFFPPTLSLKNLEAITAPSYLPLAEIWSELTL